MNEFHDKVVAVTGAASGIGWALCRRFAAGGAHVGMLDMDAESLARRVRELKRNGTRAYGTVGDVSLKAACNRAMTAIQSHFGHVDVLINNAGITQRSRFAATRAEVFERVMAVNFFGSLYCTQAVLPSLTDRRGLIIVIESVAGVTPLLGRSGYCASKHALHGLFTTLRAEVRDSGVHVLIVCPGFVRTHLQDRALGADGRVTTRPQTMMGRQQTPEDAAERIFQAARRRRNMLVLTPVGVAGYWLHRLAPGLYEILMRRGMQRELER